MKKLLRMKTELARAANRMSEEERERERDNINNNVGTKNLVFLLRYR